MIFRAQIKVFAVAALLFGCVGFGAAQTENLTAQVLAKNTGDERRILLENRSEAELKELVNNLLKESETKSDPKECGEILEIARATAEKINYKTGLAKYLFKFAIVNSDKSPQTISDFFGRAIKLMEESGDRLELATMLDSMGYTRRHMAHYDQALESYQRALKIYEELGEMQAAAQNLDGTGAIYMYLGDYNRAEAAHRQSLAISEKINLQDGVARALFHLGIVNRLRGNYADALRLYQESREITDTFAAEKPNDFPSATTLRHIGGAYFLQGNLRLALDYNRQALALDERRNDVQGKAYGLQMNAVIRVAEKNYAAALPIAEQTVPMFEKISDRDGLARSLTLLGNIYLAVGEYEKALENLRRALAMREASGSRDGMAAARTSIARVFLAQKKFSDAHALVDQAAASARENGNRELLWQSQALSGQIYLAQNECDKTREAFDAAIGTIESLRGEIVGGASENSLFFAERTKPYQLLAAMLAKENDFNAAFEYAERAKARVLLDSVRFGRNQQTAAMSAGEKAEENRLRGDVSSLNAQISKLTDKSKLADLQTKLEAARTALARFQTNLYATHPELRVKRGAVKPIEIGEVGSLLDEKSALLEYTVSEDAILLFVFTKTDNQVEFKTHRIAVKKDELGKNISRFRQMLADRNVLFAAESRKLYDSLLRPAAAQIAGKTNLIIVPDDGLWELPFQALQSSENRYVLDDAGVSYTPSLTMMRELRAHQNQPNSDPKTLLAFGNPTSGAAKILNAGFAALPEAEKQTLALKNLYGANNVRVFNRQTADEAALRRETANDFSILHLATHGVLDNQSPLNSYVLLAPNAARGDDGRLEAWEILEMDLTSDLVMLSACETARGQARSGEGLVGLAWSLMVAGARNVVVSQWKVESSSTTDLTIEFYKFLKQNAAPKKPEALRQAALKLRRNSATAHPFYWAGFVLIGEAE